MLRSLLILFLCATSLAQIRVPDHPLNTLKPGHPRLIATTADLMRIKELIKTDETAGSLYASLKNQADRILVEPAVTHPDVGQNENMLAVSRLCLERVYTLALIYRLSGEVKYRDRALKELRSAAAFPDWDPSHFLDDAEMTNAMAIGYDWLYQDLSQEDRSLFRHAIQEKGLDEAIKTYNGNASWERWDRKLNNWNFVCNGGITLGALAIADEDPQRAEFILKHSVPSTQLAWANYAPDGGWPEGPGYWQYGTTYAALYVAGLESALGTDFGMSSAPGFAHTGDFHVYFQGPSGGNFNFSDSAFKPSAPVMFWLAKRFSQPVYAWDELRHLNSQDRFKPFDLIWYQPTAQGPVSAGWPTRKVFSGANVAFLRSDWTSPDAVWVGVKGGNNHFNHTHLDLGSFVLDAHGTRWGLDLSGDDYSLPGYFGAERYTYYRTSTQAHNTVLIDGQNQDLMAKAPVTMQNGIVTVDLSATYPGKVTKFLRTIELTPQNAVIVRDDIEASRPVEALWGMLTDAQISLDGRRAALRKGAANLQVEIVSPEGAVFDTASTKPSHAGENPNTGTQKLVIHLPNKVTAVHIEVVLR